MGRGSTGDQRALSVCAEGVSTGKNQERRGQGTQPEAGDWVASSVSGHRTERCDDETRDWRQSAHQVDRANDTRSAAMDRVPVAGVMAPRWVQRRLALQPELRGGGRIYGHVCVTPGSLSTRPASILAPPLKLLGGTTGGHNTLRCGAGRRTCVAVTSPSCTGSVLGQAIQRMRTPQCGSSGFFPAGHCTWSSASTVNASAGFNSSACAAGDRSGGLPPNWPPGDPPEPAPAGCTSVRAACRSAVGRLRSPVWHGRRRSRVCDERTDGQRVVAGGRPPACGTLG